MLDQRVFARIKTRLPMRWLSSLDGTQSEAETIDITANGIGFVTREDLPCGAPLELWLSLPQRPSPLHTKGEVVWSQYLAESNQQRVGVRFATEEFMSLAWLLKIQNAR